MTRMEDIQALADRIIREFQPQRIILFGSYAWGNPSPDSDVDLLVILPFEGKSWQMASRIRSRACPSFPMDLLVRTPEQVSARLAQGDSFLKEITSRGIVLHET
ncbi:MAG: nucleotidyltransferase domain-containing protein [Anaerolineae bacterium]|nr:nucleotidyltransferase domain-containing protein [Anaerolineae bacterium]